MRVDEANDEFSVRYYRWALDDARKEVTNSMPLLRSLNTTLALRAVALLDALDDADRQVAATGLVKRFHPRAVEITREALTPAETFHVRRWESASVTPTQIEHTLREDLRTRGRVSKAGLVRAVQHRLGGIFGRPPEQITADVRRWVTGFGAWEVQTWVDVGGRRHQLLYEHKISRAPSYRLQERISFLAWMGIAGQTHWDLLGLSNEEKAAASLTEVCSRFMTAVPALVDNLPDV